MTSYKEYRWMWDNYPKLGIIRKMPIHIDLELTTRCNYNCVMCEHSSSNSPKLMDIPFKMAKKIVKQFAEGGGCSIKFVYLGEPLLYKKLSEIIKYAKKKGIVDTILASNGSLLTPDSSTQIIKAGLDWITFSVDSCQPEIYKQIRINGNLKIVTRNIRGFHDVRNMLESKTPKIVIQCIKMDLNKDEIDSGQYTSFWSPYADEIRFSRLETYANRKILPEASGFFCASPFRRLTIRADGKIALCCGERRDNKIFGDIRKNTIKEVWMGKEFQNIRDLLKEGKAHLIEQCQICTGLLSYHKEMGHEPITG